MAGSMGAGIPAPTFRLAARRPELRTLGVTEYWPLDRLR